MNDFKQEAMAEAGFDKLPKASTKKYTGLAVAQLKKVNGTKVYAVCHYDQGLGKTLVAHDFARGMVDEILEVYPDPKRMTMNETEVLAGLREKLIEEGEDPEAVGKYTKARCVKDLKEILRIKEELKKLGVDEGSSELHASLKDLVELKKKTEDK